MLLLESARYFRNWAVDDDEDRRLCLWATKAVGFFYCLVIMAVMLFLHHRASIASERNSPLMRFIFVLIMFMVPFSFAVGWISDAFVVPHQGAGVCVPHYPLPLSIALLIGNTALSGLLIYKFVSVLQYHAREWRRIKGGMSGGTAPAQRNILAIAGHAKTIASRNLFYSTSALLFSDVTMIALTSMDIANINHPDQIIMTVVDIAGSIDVFVNVLAIFACSSIWMPHEMKSRFSGPRHAASPTASRAGRRDVDRRPSQQPLSVDNQFGSMGRGRIGYQGESTQGIDANTLNMAFSDGEDDRFGDAKRYQGGPTAQHYQQHQHQHQQQQPQQSWSLGYLRTMQLPADPAPTGSPVYPSTSPYPLLTSAGPPTGSSGHSQSTLVGVPTNRIPQQHLQQQQQLPAQHGNLSYPPSYPPVQGNPQQQQPYRQQYQQQYHQQYQQQQQQQQQHQPYGRSNTYGMEAGGGTATAQQQQQTLQLSGEANWSNRVPEPWWISHPGK
ncbi:hypothetical protein DFJ73DRAFT_854532 [Zopfochytrium polystomum]|nr:hypothetical protein DFJ73DRAFT_854532 [Zopfochytrium polystomum]